jgi:hypothetical protein
VSSPLVRRQFVASTTGGGVTTLSQGTATSVDDRKRGYMRWSKSSRMRRLSRTPVYSTWVPCKGAVMQSAVSPQ